MKQLEGKVAFVTGAARGQGAIEAALLAAEGARVILADVRDDEGRATAQAIPGAHYVHLDVSSEQGWRTALDTAVGPSGRLDILVNNAGILHISTLEETSLEDFQKVLSINLAGVFLGMKQALPHMKQNGGSIVNIASIAGLTGRRTLAAYGASKWGIRGLTKTAALEFAPYRIRVNAVLPGLIDTPMIHDIYGADKIAQRGGASPVGRAGSSEDIAKLVLFLASDASAFCNGADFVADGGETVGM